MALSIKNPETERLARELAELTGETITEAVTIALREQLRRCPPATRKRSLAEIVREIQERVAAVPVLDHRTPDEILGYDEFGLPT